MTDNAQRTYWSGWGPPMTPGEVGRALLEIGTSADWEPADAIADDLAAWAGGGAPVVLIGEGLRRVLEVLRCREYDVPSVLERGECLEERAAEAVAAAVVEWAGGDAPTPADTATWLRALVALLEGHVAALEAAAGPNAGT